jgi:hypothetical protein
MFFSERRLTAVEQLERQLEANPEWPFRRTREGDLEYRVRYTRFFVGLALTALSVVLIAAFSASGLAGSSYFLYPVALLLFGVFTAANYREERSIVLSHDAGRYQFRCGRAVVQEGRLHNVYVRLRKRMDHFQGHYFLILSGFHVDPQIISGVSQDAAALRKLGHRMSQNLRINYFDEPNISSHHRVVHWRPGAAQGVVPGAAP